MQNDISDINDTDNTRIDTNGCNSETAKEAKENPNPSPPTIKHIVCSGGGVTGLTFYGILKTTHQHKIWDLKHIKSIYGTSAGSLLAIIISLDYEWNILDDYFIKRPWQNVFKINMSNLFAMCNCKGIFSKKVFEELLSPLFGCKDIPMNVTMKEFYELTKIDIHIFTTELNAFQYIDISHTTHPEWKVLDAVYCSCCLPILFPPRFIEGACYVDGGILIDYPLPVCIQKVAARDEILGINRNYKIKKVLTEESSLFDYTSVLINKSHTRYLNTVHNNIPNEICVEDEPLQIQSFYDTAASMEERIRLIQRGVDLAQDFVLSSL